MPKPLVIATRNSPLALWQAKLLQTQLQQLEPTLKTELLPLTTTGDKFLANSLQAIGGKGLFVKELEEALLDARADVAVHSMKDVPLTMPEGLTIAAMLERHNPQDALLGNYLIENARVGTTSLRRQSQLSHLKPNIKLLPLRGNINTRIAKLNQGDFDAIILAYAGLERLGLANLITHTFSIEEMLPACGQGALGIECRLDDTPTCELLSQVNHANTQLCVNTERLVNSALGGSCRSPLAVYCELQDATLVLRARIVAADNQDVINVTVKGADATIAKRCIADLEAQGARKLLQGWL